MTWEEIAFTAQSILDSCDKATSPSPIITAASPKGITPQLELTFSTSGLHNELVSLQCTSKVISDVEIAFRQALTRLEEDHRQIHQRAAEELFSLADPHSADVIHSLGLGYERSFQTKAYEFQNAVLQAVMRYRASVMEGEVATPGKPDKFTSHQTSLLTKAFEATNHSINTFEKELLARKTGLSEKQVSTWFANQRQKLARGPNVRRRPMGRPPSNPASLSLKKMRSVSSSSIDSTDSTDSTFSRDSGYSSGTEGDIDVPSDAQWDMSEFDFASLAVGRSEAPSPPSENGANNEWTLDNFQFDFSNIPQATFDPNEMLENLGTTFATQPQVFPSAFDQTLLAATPFPSFSSSSSSVSSSSELDPTGSIIDHDASQASYLYLDSQGGLDPDFYSLAPSSSSLSEAPSSIPLALDAEAFHFAKARQQEGVQPYANNEWDETFQRFLRECSGGNSVVTIAFGGGEDDMQI